MESRPPLPPFTRESAELKVRMAEDAWNSCNPEKYLPCTRQKPAGVTGQSL